MLEVREEVGQEAYEMMRVFFFEEGLRNESVLIRLVRASCASGTVFCLHDNPQQDSGVVVRPYHV